VHDILVRTTRIPAVTALIILALSAACSFAQDRARLALPADFIQQLKLPGASDELLRPQKVFFDRAASELYVVDQGHNRIVIFDFKGTYRFEFSVDVCCGSVHDLVVTSKGSIIVLGSTKDGLRLMRFDFDGTFLGEIDANIPRQGQPLKMTSLAIDGKDRIYILDESVPRIIRLSADFAYDMDFPILTDANEKTIRETVFGALSVSGSELLLPISSGGVVYRYGIDGEFHGSLGRPGSKIGELNFPVSTQATGDGMILVLDEKRFAVLCYTGEGRYLGEFGGMGISPGWFYYPSWIAVDANDRVYVSQIFLNRVQVCRIPPPIQNRLLAARKAGPAPSAE
jgi:DNA-binding beta-propeller fold protein YncE